MKNIVLCADGTGNSLDRLTNIGRIYDAIDVNGHRSNASLVQQVAIYDDGVGTEMFPPVRWFSGATGRGLTGKVRELYESITRVFEPGDRLFLFGFSRGAFTVRALTSLVRACGILDSATYRTQAELQRSVKLAYAAYRRAYLGWGMRRQRGLRESHLQDFRERNRTFVQATIGFLGIFDSVDSVGLPLAFIDHLNR